MSETKPDDTVPAAPAEAPAPGAPEAVTSSPAPAGAPHEAQAAAAGPAGAVAGAVDTGRRIDPSLLGGGGGPGRTVLRDSGRRTQQPFRPAPEGESDAPVGSPAAAAAAQDTTGVLDASAIEARARAGAAAEGQGPGGGGEGRRDGPRRDGPGGGGGGPRRDGPRRDGPGGGGGPRRDGPGGGGGGGAPGMDKPRFGPRRDGPPQRGGPRRDGPPGPRAAPSDAGPAFVERKPTAPEEAGDFAAMLAESGPIDHVDIRVGDRVKATCLHISKETAFFQLSGTQEANMPTAEFLDDEGAVTLHVGDTIDAFVTALAGGIVLSTKIGKGMIDAAMLEQARAAGIPIDGTVTGVNKGGLEVSIGGTRGFCPIGQADINFVEDPTALIGKTFAFLIKEVKEKGKNVLVSRKALLERERKEKSAELLKTLAVGQVLEGSVSRLQAFGVFVDLGGVDGLIPMSELSYSRVGNASDIVKVGEKLKVEVTRIEDDPKRQGQLRIGLSLKSLMEDPFDAHERDMTPGATLLGRIAKLETFGAFVELFPGVQGLVHISEIADQRIRHPSDVLAVDERVKVRVLDLDRGARRVSLSLREAKDRTDEEVQQQQPAAPVQRRSGPQRGMQVEGTVERIEKYGVFVQLDGHGAALMPASETGTPRGTDLNRVFPVGTRMSLLVIEVDERNRVKVSKVAREQAEERALVAEYNTGSGAAAGLGTFADLLKRRK